MSKYHATRTIVDSITFDSKREAARYAELKLMQRAGLISDLRRQVKYELIPKQQGGAVSANQRMWINRLNANGNRAVVCKGWLEARDTILNYLEDKK